MCDAYSAEQVLTKCLLLALFFFHLFRTYYFPEWSRWIHRGRRALRDTVPALRRPTVQPAWRALSSVRHRPSRRARAPNAGRCPGVRVAPGPADAAGLGARPSVLEPGCEAGRACRVSRHKPSGRLLRAQGPGFLPSPGRAGTGVSRSSPAPRGVSDDQGEGAQGPGVRVTFPAGGLRGLRRRKPAPQGWKPAPQ